MSGHSHWSTIKYKKEMMDSKRSKIFSKLAKEISIAARDGGSDMTFNPRLRTIVDKARDANMPSDNIDKAIKKGAGELEGCTYEEFSIEAYGPDGTALIIDGITDNKNRSFGEIKLILNQRGGKMVEGGGIKWMFDKKGVIMIDKQSRDKEDLELLAIESGADNFDWGEEYMTIYTKPEELDKVKNFFIDNQIKPKEANLEWVAKELVQGTETTQEKFQKLYEALDDHDDVQNIYTNLN
ncbi:MAG: YebC/PmpR family DNA-binding transcriptional regulator [Minisyncoccus archaeiphilus]|mgnify:CR=1 FL=1|uniref:YebC/PmpR family DNA-binding transcriptional regulator n=1 Tax=Minisyncoccus archaeiphilus TaxID=3238481 RepID=UPI0009C56251|nr:MAG: putative transcriptional regulatory protein [Parcubacteria group bacterium ADurb.Bin216]GMX59042.1 MAG: YebC/PmpR family DNA-binding transcriptional regulator [Candidatus Parcubacteria bacterium]